MGAGKRVVHLSKCKECEELFDPSEVSREQHLNHICPECKEDE